MYAEMTKTDLTKTISTYEQSRAVLEQAQSAVLAATLALNDAAAVLRSTVQISKNQGTITLTFGARVLKATVDAKFRMTVKENGRVLVSNYSAGTNNLRLALALGQI